MDLLENAIMDGNNKSNQSLLNYTMNLDVDQVVNNTLFNYTMETEVEHSLNNTIFDYAMETEVEHSLNNTLFDYAMGIDVDYSLNKTDDLTSNGNNQTLHSLTDIDYNYQSLLEYPLQYLNNTLFNLTGIPTTHTNDTFLNAAMEGDIPSYMTHSVMNFTDIPAGDADHNFYSYGDMFNGSGHIKTPCNSNEHGLYFSNNSSLSENNFSNFYDILFMEDPNELKYPWLSNESFFPTLTLYLVTLIFGTTGNIAAIILMAGERKTRTTTNIFLVSLSVADLLMLLICVPLQIITYFVVLWDSGGTVCKMTYYFMLLSFTASVLNLTALSLE
ncbi:unnamed protein product, partial [Meganyctiphanes norvegica]